MNNMRRLAAYGCVGTLLALAMSSAASARTLSVRDEGYMRFSRSSGSQLTDEGTAKGTLPGKAVVRFTYDGSPTVSATFTISGNGWSLRGHASGRLSNPASLAPSFRGTLTLSGGSGRYARAQGTGELFGVFYRRSYALTVQAVVRLRY